VTPQPLPPRSTNMAATLGFKLLNAQREPVLPSSSPEPRRVPRSCSCRTNELVEGTDASPVGSRCLLPRKGWPQQTYRTARRAGRGKGARPRWDCPFRAPHSHRRQRTCPPKCQQKWDLSLPGRHSGICLVQLPFHKPQTFRFGGEAQFHRTLAN